jgi:hypothetical protein
MNISSQKPAELFPYIPNKVKPTKVKTARNLRDAAKVTKTIRCSIKLLELATNLELSNSLRFILKSTKGCKYYKTIVKRKKIPASFKRFRTTHGWRGKSKALASTIKCTRATVACIVSATTFFEETSKKT